MSDYDHDEIQAQLPFKLTEGYLGVQTNFFPYGLSAVSHPFPYQVLDTNDIEIIIGFQGKTRFTSKLLSVNPKRECNECVLAQAQGTNMHYRIVLPQVGFYKFQIYALPSNQAGPQMVGVYNYIINCTQLMRQPLAFPKQYPQWKQGCFLWMPLGLPPNVRDPAVPFKVFVPKAIDVQVKAHEDWTQLEQTEPNVYEGVVDFSRGCPSGAKVKLNVKFGGTQFNTLLEYTI